jgi:branched-chain amino acid transport system substrate-binding protein
MKKLITIILILAFAFLSFILGCTKEQKEIKIGVIASLTGPVAPYGERLIEGAQLAVEEINQHEGINGKTLRLLIEDDKSTPNDAVFAMRKLVNVNKVPVVIGLIGSSQAMAVAPIAEKSKVVLLSTGASTPDYTNAGDYCFRNRPSAEQEVKKMAEVAYNVINARKIAVLYVDNDYGKSYSDVFVKRFRELGGEITQLESFSQGSTDMRTQLSKIKDSPVDAIYLVGQAIEDANVVRQAKELGIDAQILATIGVETGDFIKLAGDAGEGIIYTAASYNPDNQDSNVKHFEDLYEAKYKRRADLFAATAYDAIHILADAVQSNDYTSDKIKTALYNVKNYPGASGLTTFDRNGDVIKPIAIKKIKGKQFIYLNDDLSETR